ETKINHIPRDLYHTDWVADRTLAFLDSLDEADDWFVWISFPDPHPPWDPPGAEHKRVPWRDLDLPPGHPGSPDAIRDVLAQKPPHWLGFYEGSWHNVEGGPARFVPTTLADDQPPGRNAITHVMNELNDAACSPLPEQISRRLGLADGGPRSSVVYDGTEGELYRVYEDPHQFRNLWEDPGYRSVRSDLVSDLYDSLPAEREPKLPVSRPA